MQVYRPSIGLVSVQRFSVAAGELGAWQLLPGESLLPQEVARRGFN